MPFKFLAACALGLSVWAAQAHGFTIDASLADWGISVADNNASLFNPDPTVELLALDEEDQSDTAGDSAFLGPHRGGQNYDAEVLAVSCEGDRLFIAIVSGQRPDNGFERYGPGDLRIETSGGTYGLEMGGGIGGGSGSVLAGGATGSTYTLNQHGFTTGYADADSRQTVGSIWRSPEWILDPIVNTEPTQMEIGATGTLVGAAEIAFSRDMITSQHSIIELSFDATMFNGETIESLHWRPACGNDELDVELSFVPEPSTIGFMMLGVVVMLRRKTDSRGC